MPARRCHAVVHTSAGPTKNCDRWTWDAERGKAVRRSKAWFDRNPGEHRVVLTRPGSKPPEPEHFAQEGAAGPERALVTVVGGRVSGRRGRGVRRKVEGREDYDADSLKALQFSPYLEDRQAYLEKVTGKGLRAGPGGDIHSGLIPEERKLSQRMDLEDDDELAHMLGLNTYSFYYDPHVKVDVQYHTYHVGGREVAFGGVPGVTYEEEVLPRNPYVIARIDPTTPEGRAVGSDYVHALIALGEMRNQKDRTVAGEVERMLGWSSALINPDDITLALEEVGLEGMAGALLERGYTPPDTFVDALLLASAEGDDVAAAHLEALSAAGRRLVELENDKRVLSARSVKEACRKYSEAARKRDELEKLGVYGEERDRAVDDMRDGELSYRTWYEATAEVLEKRRERLIEVEAEINRTRSEEMREVEDEGELSKIVAKYEPLLKAAGDERRMLREEKEKLERLGSYAVPAVGLTEGRLVAVHETSHQVERDEEGHVIVRPAGDHSEHGVRDSVHLSINHPVIGHLERAQPEDSTLILIPLDRLVEDNPGSLYNLYTVDTRMAPEPRKGIRFDKDHVVLIEGGDPESRKESAKKVIEGLGASWAGDAGKDYAELTDRRLAPIAMAEGIASGRHAGADDYLVESALASRGAMPGSSEGLLGASSVRRIGLNGLLRMFDRGGVPPYGRPVEYAWIGAEFQTQRVGRGRRRGEPIG